MARLRFKDALALGVLHGPAELLPISSSGHMTLIPWLLDWEYEAVDPELRKAFEVALHAGTAAALLITLREEVIDVAKTASPRLVMLIGLSFAPPAAIGYLLEKPIEQKFGRPGSIGVALIIGAAAMAVADRTPQTRTSDDAGVVDSLLLGVAQACALVPGISRNGATLSAARWRGFTRADAEKLSRHVALPVIGAATGLKLARLAQRGLPEGAAVPFATGAVASFVSTLGSTWLIRQVERDRSLLPYSLYRGALGAVVLRRLARQR